MTGNLRQFPARGRSVRRGIAGAAIALGCALAAVGGWRTASAQIFTTAPSHLQGLVPTAPAAEPAPPGSRAAPRRIEMAPPPTAEPAAPQTPPPQFVAPHTPAPVNRPAVAGPSTRPEAARTMARPLSTPSQPVRAPSPLASAPLQLTPAPADLASAPADAEPSAPVSLIRHLTNNIQGFRLTGEISALEWPVYFTRSQAQARLQFRAGYLSAVSVMPEASHLKLVINDTVVGTANIRPTRGARTILFDIPAGLIEPGFNSVRLTAEQRHRVDCSLRATYELWTQIDPTRTGFVLPDRDPGVTSLADLPALPPDSQGALPIRIVTAGKTSRLTIERAMQAVQKVALLGRFEQPVADVGELAGGQHGINLVVGTIDEIAPVARALSIGAVSGPRLAVIPGRQGLRTSIVITGRTREDIDIALLQFDEKINVEGSEAGLRAIRAFPGYRVTGGQRVRLRDMGIASEEFSGRFYKAAFNVLMPPDFYAADYGQAYLELAGGYAPGLTNEAEIVVSVNGKNAVSMKLPKSGGDIFRQTPVPLRLGHLRPGLNRIEINAMVPVAADDNCDPLAAIGNRSRFLLLDTTEFVLPRIARIARAPDLVITTTGGFPYAGAASRPILYVPQADAHSVGASATLAAHLAISAGRAIDFRFQTERPAPGEGATLMIAPSGLVDEALLGALGLNGEQVRAAWADQARAPDPSEREEPLSRWDQITRERLILQRNFPAACHMRQPHGGYRAAFLADMMPVATTGGDHDRNLIADWDERIRSQSRIIGYFSGFVKGVSDWTQGRVSGARSWIDTQLDAAPEASPINADTSLIMAQSILGRSSSDIWTLVTAPSTGRLAQAVGCLVDPRVWQQVGGRAAMLRSSEAQVTTLPITSSRLIPTQSLSVGNVRLIVAGWFSLNSKVYVFFALLMALLLAFSTNWFVRNAGRKAE